MTRLYRLSLAALALLLAFAACERRPLEVITNDKVRVKLVAKWRVVYTDLYGEEPSGMTVMLWGNNQSAPIVETTNDDNVILWLQPDVYRVIVFNQMEREFLPYLRFYQQNSYDDMVARNTLYTSSNDGQQYTYYPDPIGVATDTFEITRDMVLQDTVYFAPYEDYIDKGPAAFQNTDRYYEIPEVPWPMTVNVYLVARVKHRQSIKGMAASLSGLADGFYLSKIIRTQETATIEFDQKQWTYTIYGEEKDSLGQITNSTASFGLPYGKELLSQRDSTDNILKLNIILTNDSVMDLTFNVGKNIRYLTPEGREAEIRYRQDLQNLRLEVELPDIINVPIINGSAGTGFDAEVVDWEEGGIIDMGGF